MNSYLGVDPSPKSTFQVKEALTINEVITAGAFMSLKKYFSLELTED